MSDPFEKWMNRGQIVVNVKDVSDYVRETEEMLRTTKGIWSREDVRKLLEKKYGSENIALSGMAKIVKGENPAVGLTSDQMETIEVIGDFSHGLSGLGKNSIYVSVENNQRETEQARLQHVFARVPEGRIVISKGLADKLHLSDDDSIKVSFSGQDLSDLDLDR